MSTQDGVPFRLGWKAVSLGKGFALSGSGHQEGKGNMDAKEAIALIEERFDLLETQSHYQVLGVERDASVADIRAAYRTLAKKFHADRFRAYMLNDGQQKKLEAVFNRLGKANSILTNEPRRAEYDNEIGASGVARERKVTADEMERIFGAEDALRRGKGMLQRGDIKGALAKFRVAFEVSADIPDVAAHYAFARFLDGEGSDSADGKKAFKELEVLVRENKDDVSANLFYAKALKLKKQTDEAKKYFNRVLAKEPNHPEAKREVRLAASRSGASDKVPLYQINVMEKLRSFFKKKE